MGKKKAYIKFEAEYSQEVKELLVLTSESVGGACSAGDGLWEARAEFLASVDPESGELSEQQGSLSWLCEDKDRGDWVYDLKKLTVYRVRCREKLDKTAAEGMRPAWVNSYLLVEVMERDLSHPELNRILEAYREPVWLTDELCGRFQLERRFDWFSADVDWLGEECNVSLVCDEEGKDTADKALAVFKKIYADREEWDKNFRAFAAEELTELANEWLEDLDDSDFDEDDLDDEDSGDDDFDDGDVDEEDDSDEDGLDDEDDSDEDDLDDEDDFDEDDSDDDGIITKEEFAKRIGISELSVEPNGDYIAYYYDDDMFLGHIIMIMGNVDTGMEDASIAG